MSGDAEASSQMGFRANRKDADGAGSGQPAGRRRGFGVGRIAGIELRADPSVLLIMGLIVFSLATGVLAQWHPEWGGGLRWGAAIIAAVLFFISLLAHELAHSLVARSRGIAVPRITLFLFGGMSEMESEPKEPGDEFWVAIVGPVTSLVLGVAFLGVAHALAGSGFEEALLEDPEQAMASLGLAPTLLLWLGPINILLALFNLVPGFPLDGGRVLRAALWKWTGDVVKATRWSAAVGNAVAWTLIALGAFQLLQGNMGGLWLMLVGWFLSSAARSSHTQLLLRKRMEGVAVRDLMHTRFETVEPDVQLDEFVEQRLLRGEQDAWPVVEDGEPVGMVSPREVRRVAPDARAQHRVRDVMRPLDESVSADLCGKDALKALTNAEHDPLAVMEDGRLVGLLYRSDIGRHMALHALEEDEL